eukprot:5959614-Pyramimonas_sp.AAC.1
MHIRICSMVVIGVVSAGWRHRAQATDVTAQSTVTMGAATWCHDNSQTTEIAFSSLYPQA